MHIQCVLMQIYIMNRIRVVMCTLYVMFYLRQKASWLDIGSPSYFLYKRSPKSIPQREGKVKMAK